MVENGNADIFSKGQFAQDAMREGPENGLIGESLFQIAWRNRWLILGCVLLTIAAGFVYVQKATPIYESTSQVFVEQSGPKIFGEAQGVLTQSKNYLYTQATLLTSTPIISNAMDSPGVSGLKTFAEIDNIVGYLRKNVSVSVGKKDDIITVAFESPYPAEAAQLVNALVDAYITYHSTTKKNTSAEVLAILQKEKQKINTELNAKLAAMVAFKKANEALAFENRNSNIILDRLTSLSEAVTQAQLKTIEEKSNYETIRSMVSDPLKLQEFVRAQRARGFYVSSETESLRLQRQLDQLQLELTDLTTQVTSDHPSVRAKKVKIAQVQTQLSALDKGYAEAQLAIAMQQYESARQREEEITEFFENQRSLALTLNEQVAQYLLLESDWQQTKKLSDLLDDRIKELNVTEDVGALNISILEVARPADDPSKPQKARVLAMALMLGLMAGGGLSLVRDFLDHRLRSAEEIQAILGTPILGTIPGMSSRQSISDRGTKVHRDSGSITAEAYRTVRTAVFFGVPEGSAKTLLVTSPDKGDGKTTLTSNLAIAMAQAGQTTLLIDADLRKPKQHLIFGADKDRGLSALVAGRLTEEEAIQATEVPGLSILTAGPDVPNPSELLNNQAFGKKLKALAQKYDRIIIDSPPVAPVSDSRILAAICDVTLLVVRANKSTRNVSRHACEGLYSVGARLLGTIVNDVSPGKGYYGYGYGNSYGHKEKAAG